MRNIALKSNNYIHQTLPGLHMNVNTESGTTKNVILSTSRQPYIYIVTSDLFNQRL